MIQRERFLQTLNGGIPDRPPVFATITPQVAQKISRLLGIPYEKPLDSLLSSRISHMAMLTKLGNDAAGIAACAPEKQPTYKDANGVIINEWGMRFKETGLYNEFESYPLSAVKTSEQIDRYEFPNPQAKGRFDQAALAIDHYGQTFGIIADLECTLFETAWYLVGLEKLLTDLMYREPYVQPLLDKIMQINLEIGKNLILLGADMIWAGDDFGGQHGLIMSPEIWRELFKPRIKYMFEQFRKVNPKIKIAWHSCGSIRPIIPDFIEIGLDVLNPIQPLAHQMDPCNLKTEFGKDLIFFGGIDIQELLPNASPKQIKADVQRKIEILGKNGGYIIAPAHNIQDDTPVENILAFFEAIRDYSG